MLRTDTVTDVTTCITTQHSWAVTIGDSVTKLYNLVPGQGGCDLFDCESNRGPGGK